MKRSSSITTGQGDAGRTRLFSGEEVSKACERTEAYGALDEAVSILGIARGLTADGELGGTLMELQRELFVAGAELATTVEFHHRLKERIDAARLEALDARRSALEASTAMPKGFVLPGGDPVAAQLDLARAVIRRCERRAVALRETGEVDNPQLLIWLNRLSDYLWILARSVEGEKVDLK